MLIPMSLDDARSEPVAVAAVTEAAKAAAAAAAAAAVAAVTEAAAAAATAAEAAATAASKAATAAPGTQASADAVAAARAAAATAHEAALTVTAAVTKARAAGKATLGSAWPFLAKGLRDFKTNIKRTWPVILAFIIYLFASASALYGFLRVSAQIPSWLQALYSTWLSMSTAGELTSKSSKWVWAFGALNTLVGLLFFGFIVWLVTTSLYQAPDR